MELEMFHEIKTAFYEKICGNSSVGRALASQAGGREFEPRLPLMLIIKELYLNIAPFFRFIACLYGELSSFKYDNIRYFGANFGQILVTKVVKSRGVKQPSTRKLSRIVTNCHELSRIAINISDRSLCYSEIIATFAVKKPSFRKWLFRNTDLIK